MANDPDDRVAELDPSRDRSATAEPDFAADLTSELPRLSRLALHLTRDPARAEDLAQEAALRAWAKRDQLRDGAPIGPWLNRILVNLVIDRSRSRRDEFTDAEIEDRWADDDYTVDPERVLARAELRDDLEDALARLPAGYRTVVVLHDAAGLTVAATADALGIGLPAAKQRLRRGRMMLVSALADDDPKRAASLAQPMRCGEARGHISAYLDAELEPGAGHSGRGAPWRLSHLPTPVHEPRGAAQHAGWLARSRFGGA